MDRARRRGEAEGPGGGPGRQGPGEHGPGDRGAGGGDRPLPALLEALDGHRPTRTPVWFMRQAGRSLPEYRRLRARAGTSMLEACLDPGLAALATVQPVRRHGVDAAVLFSDIMVPLLLAGVGVRIVEGTGPVLDAPVRSARDVTELVAHRYGDAPGRPRGRGREAGAGSADGTDRTEGARGAEGIRAVAEAVRRAVAELGTPAAPGEHSHLPARAQAGLAESAGAASWTPVIGFGGAPFTLAAYLVEGRPSRDYLAARTLMHSDPASWDRLMTWCARLTGAFIATQVSAGACAAQLFDSWAGALSPALYRSRVLPYSSLALEVASREVSPVTHQPARLLHFGTGTARILADMRAAGAHAVGVDDRTSLAEAVGTLAAGDPEGGSCPVQGNLDPALLAARWPVLARGVDACLAEGQAAPAHVVNLGHGVPPSTDPDTLTRVVARVHGSAQWDAVAVAGWQPEEEVGGDDGGGGLRTGSRRPPSRGVPPGAPASTPGAPGTPGVPGVPPGPPGRPGGAAVTGTRRAGRPHGASARGAQAVPGGPSGSGGPEPPGAATARHGAGTQVEPREWDAVVVGGGIAGLSAAWELARAGLRPLLVEARGYTGGLVAGAQVAGVPLDLGAEGFAARGGASPLGVEATATALGLSTASPQGRARLFLPPLPTPSGGPGASGGPTGPDSPGASSTPGSSTSEGPGEPGGPSGPGEPGTSRGWGLHAFPARAVLGIPADPLARDVVSVIGTQAAARAAQDRELPASVGTGAGDPGDLASLVRARMGEGVLDRLVRPVVAGIHSADPGVLDADTVAPGLREAVARLGSLGAAVEERVRRREAARRGQPPTGGQGATAATDADGPEGLPPTGGRGGSTAGRRGGSTAGRRGGSTAGRRGGDLTVEGGLSRLTDALRQAVEAAGGRVLTRTGAQWLRQTAPGAWEVAVAATARGPSPSDEPVPVEAERVVSTTRVVLACSATAALRLLGGAPGVGTDVAVPRGSSLARLVLVVRAPGLDAAPVGSGLLVAPPPATGPDNTAPCPVRAKAMSHLSLKWPWVGQRLRERHGEGVHALRLSYGRPGQPRPEVDLASALDDVASLTGVRVPADDVLDHVLARWEGTLPPFTPGYRQRVARLEGQVAGLEGLAVTGAWVAGTGIASVVPHARAAAVGLVAGA